jgi:hypothetical protein
MSELNICIFQHDTEGYGITYAFLDFIPFDAEIEASFVTVINPVLQTAKYRRFLSNKEAAISYNSVKKQLLEERKLILVYEGRKNNG